MKANVEPQPKSTVRLTVELTPQEMQKHFEAVVQQLQGQVDIKGFRKGKVPRGVLEQRFGAEYLAHEALERAVSLSYYDAVKQHDIQAVGKPQTELPDDHHQSETKGLTYVAHVPVMPTVDLGEYQKVRVKPVTSTFSDELVGETVEQLRKSRASFGEVDRPAQAGDRVEIDFVGRHKGVEFEGGRSANHPLVIGEDNLIPGFSDELKKMKKGQTKKFKIKFPKEYHEPTLAGEKVEFEVTMKDVQERTLPEENDEFAAQLGAKSMDDLRTRLNENLKAEKELEAKRANEEAVVEKILEGATIEVPTALVDEEAQRMVHDLQHNVESQGMPFDKYLEQLGKTVEELVAERHGDAERRVQTSLVLSEVAKLEKIKPTAKEIEAEITSGLANVSEEQRAQIDPEEYRRYVERILTNQAVLNTLVTRATEK